MLGFKKKGGPTRPYSHATDCKILKADPGVEIPWQEIETGYWIAECVCGKEYWREPLANGRIRLDPLDPSTFRHAPACDQRAVTDPASSGPPCGFKNARATGGSNPACAPVVGRFRTLPRRTWAKRLTPTALTRRPCWRVASP
jgi:hypothetical protein